MELNRSRNQLDSRMPVSILSIVWGHFCWQHGPFASCRSKQEAIGSIGPFPDKRHSRGAEGEIKGNADFLNKLLLANDRSLHIIPPQNKSFRNCFFFSFWTGLNLEFLQLQDQSLANDAIPEQASKHASERASNSSRSGSLINPCLWSAKVRKEEIDYMGFDSSVIQLKLTKIRSARGVTKILDDLAGFRPIRSPTGSGAASSSLCSAPAAPHVPCYPAEKNKKKNKRFRERYILHNMHNLHLLSSVS
jgi:hypothetical protein